MGQDEVVVGLDIGTTKVCAIIAELTPEGEPKVVGVGINPSEGVRRGVVVDMDKTVQAIQKAVQEAEMMAGLRVGASAPVSPLDRWLTLLFGSGD